MQIRILKSEDSLEYHSLRILALKESSLTLFSSYEEESEYSIDFVSQKLTPTCDKATIGAFFEENLVGIICLQREEKLKLAHKVIMSGVYVNPAARRKGICHKLIDFSISYAFNTLCVRQINLAVTVTNTLAIKIYESFGFTKFGIEPDFMFVNDSFHDVFHMVRHLHKKA